MTWDISLAWERNAEDDAVRQWTVCFTWISPDNTINCPHQCSDFSCSHQPNDPADYYTQKQVSDDEDDESDEDIDEDEEEDPYTADYGFAVVQVLYQGDDSYTYSARWFTSHRRFSIDFNEVTDLGYFYDVAIWDVMAAAYETKHPDEDEDCQNWVWRLLETLDGTANVNMDSGYKGKIQNQART